ncbi:hypothetical protein BC332_25192 [Capsicum chinense]|nr:hypothetical protein BC332_25192 [Capsicum chinense]
MNLDKLKKNYKSGCSKKLSAWRKKLRILGKESNGDLSEELTFAKSRLARLEASLRKAEETKKVTARDINFQSYGIRSIRVDGNNALAIFTAVQEARRIAVNKHKTVLVEALRKKVNSAHRRTF